MTAKMFTGNAIVSPGVEQVTSKLGEELVILNLDSGVYYGLTGVSARVWELAQERKTAGAIRDTITDEFEVEPAVCESDLTELLDQLQALGLVRVS
jgi:hypothetical protein